MAISFDALKEHFKAAGLYFMVLPDAPVAVYGFESPAGKRFLTNLALEADGSLLQFRCNLGIYCKPDHPAHPLLLGVVNDLNHHRRAIKFSIDPNDGEVTAWADLVLIDAEPTSGQLLSMVSVVPIAVQECVDRFEAIVLTGQDPGEQEELV